MTTATAVVSPATFQAAQRGDAQALWTVYEHFYAYAREFNLNDAQHHEILRQAMRAGHPQAQFEVAKLLRGGWLTVLPDGQLGTVDQNPTQADIDRARELVEQAAAQGEEHARHMLENLPPQEWQARTLHRSPFGVHANMLRDPIQEAEEEQVVPARTHLLWLTLTLLAVVVLVWAAWNLYAAKLLQAG